MAVLALPPGQAPDDGAADAVGAQAAAAAGPESVGGESLVAGDMLAPAQEMPARHGLCEETASRLSEEVFVLYDRISRPAIARADVTQRCLDGLSEARNLLLLGDPGNLNLAERRVNQVKYAINRVDQTNRWGKSYGWTLFGFELAALALVVVALLLDQRLAWSISMALGSAAPAASMAELFGPWNMMLWGAIGGIIGALYSLHWHVSVQQDFDRQYTLWYVVQPFMGFVFGGLFLPGGHDRPVDPGAGGVLQPRHGPVVPGPAGLPGRVPSEIRLRDPQAQP